MRLVTIMLLIMHMLFTFIELSLPVLTSTEYGVVY
jgi:hypothetical protein